jgi:hypothetical protein
VSNVPEHQHIRNVGIDKELADAPSKPVIIDRRNQPVFSHLTVERRPVNRSGERPR